MKVINKLLVPKNCIYLIWILSLAYVIIGPWWVGNTPYIEEDYYNNTVKILENSKVLESSGELYVGYAQNEIVASVGQPIMGYTDRKPLDSEGVLNPSFSKSLTVRVGDKAVSIVAVDVMLLMGDIIDDVYMETGLSQDEIFFTATHTHSGVGGWFKHPVFEFFYGKYNKVYYDNLKRAIVQSILDSRKNFVRAKVKYDKVDAGEWLENRIYKDIPAPEGAGFHGVNPYLTALSFVDYDDPSNILYILTTYAAHATVVRKNVHKFSTDYPGELCAKLKELTSAKAVLFAAGSVGDARSTVLNIAGAQKLGAALAGKIAPVIKSGKAIDVTNMTSLNLPIEMPEARFAFAGPKWSVLPILASWLFDTPIHLSYLQIGEFVIVGMPMDIAGELTAELQSAKPILMTSFNGSWKGYATKEDTYLHRDTYSTRDMGLAGAQAGEYLVDIAMKTYEKVNR